MSFLIGGYGPDTGGAAAGISTAARGTDALEPDGGVLEAPSPSWIAVRGDRMVAALEGSGALASFSLSGSGWVHDAVIDLGGESPCHAAFLDDTTVAVACYGDGAVIVVDLRAPAVVQRLDGAGRGPLPAQEGPHAHHVHLTADGRVLTLDLGADALHVHDAADGRLTRTQTISLPPGTGPRDLHRLPSGHLALLGEWSCELLVLDSETLAVLDALPLSGATRGQDQAAALGVSADGRFLFAGVRGANRIAVFAIEGDDIRPLTWVSSGGDWPRHLLVDGDLLHVANQRSDEVTTFRIGADGVPVPVGRAATSAPTCVVTTTLQSLLG